MSWELIDAVVLHPAVYSDFTPAFKVSTHGSGVYMKKNTSRIANTLNKHSDFIHSAVLCICLRVLTRRFSFSQLSSTTLSFTLEPQNDYKHKSSSHPDNSYFNTRVLVIAIFLPTKSCSFKFSLESRSNYFLRTKNFKPQIFTPPHSLSTSNQPQWPLKSELPATSPAKTWLSLRNGPSLI